MNECENEDQHESDIENEAKLVAITNTQRILGRIHDLIPGKMWIEEKTKKFIGQVTFYENLVSLFSTITLLDEQTRLTTKIVKYLTSSVLFFQDKPYLESIRRYE
jgi:hypothetical protein